MRRRHHPCRRARRLSPIPQRMHHQIRHRLQCLTQLLSRRFKHRVNFPDHHQRFNLLRRRRRNQFGNSADHDRHTRLPNLNGRPIRPKRLVHQRHQRMHPGTVSRPRHHHRLALRCHQVIRSTFDPCRIIITELELSSQLHRPSRRAKPGMTSRSRHSLRQIHSHLQRLTRRNPQPVIRHPARQCVPSFNRIQPIHRRPILRTRRLPPRHELTHRLVA